MRVLFGVWLSSSSPKISSPTVSTGLGGAALDGLETLVLDIGL